MSPPQDGPTGLLGLFTNARLALLLLIAIVGTGLLALREIPKERWPAVDVPIGVVTAVYPGASPDLVEAEVTQVLERAFVGLPEMTSLQSTSMESVSLVLVEFDVGADADAALDATAEALDVVGETSPTTSRTYSSSAPPPAMSRSMSSPWWPRTCPSPSAARWPSRCGTASRPSRVWTRSTSSGCDPNRCRSWWTGSGSRRSGGRSRT